MGERGWGLNPEVVFSFMCCAMQNTVFYIDISQARRLWRIVYVFYRMFHERSRVNSFNFKFHVLYKSSSVYHDK